MSDSKVFPPVFSFSNSPTPSYSPGNERFTFSGDFNNRSSERQRHNNFRYQRRSSGHNKSAPSSSSSFQFRPIFADNGAAEKAKEKESSKETTHENGIPENGKTKFTVLSALTGTIPCNFEGSSYSSQPLERSCFATEQPIKTERDEKSVPNLSASHSQIIVSRLLKNIPQSPHFWPLRAYSEAAKRSLINAWDRIFEETVDQIQSVQVNGFGIDVKRLWETTEELQMMGYNVVPLRRRLVELTDVRKQINQHRFRKMRLKTKAEQHMMEKNKLEFEIVKLKAKVEAEKASFEDVMAKVAKMNDEMPSFNALFSKLAIKPL
ncbi:hypothetical protein BVRB_2g024000 isoform B [Beta vulgaris subsp. vulgaris]|uniref:uncharacterized protein LOC104903512 isoform X1 n=1 Tax=Beta vulgaris subsp. vulgaris TaxID=3555 RepID=UPI00053FBA13|nr:uncharacterized protein LOC104903512 isoform X1 [Beta vulgaris subsp. vulgaris]KMT18233.1 hypothetical protein BVRB_2g024000 isoform B [Beta vulgaris subsp. vulgaris]